MTIRGGSSSGGRGHCQGRRTAGLEQPSTAAVPATFQFVLLSSHLFLQGDVDEALALLCCARGRHVTDFWIHFLLGRVLDDCLRLAPCRPTTISTSGIHPRRSWKKQSAVVEQPCATSGYWCCPRQSRLRTATQGPVGRGHRLLQEGHRTRPEARRWPTTTWALRCKARASWTRPSPATGRPSNSTRSSPAPTPTWAWALWAKGQLDEAIACYRKAIELDPKHADAHINLGVH